MSAVTTKPVPLPAQPTLIPLRPVEEIELPKTLFLDFVSPPLQVDWNAVCGSCSGGVFTLMLDAAQKVEILDVRKFRRVNVQVTGTKAKACMSMGKISGSTLSMSRELRVSDSQQGYAINSFDVNGPEISIWLSGSPALGVEKVQLWVYLTS